MYDVLNETVIILANFFYFLNINLMFKGVCNLKAKERLIT